MKLPYLGANNPMIMQLHRHLVGQNHGRCPMTSPSSSVGSTRFRFQQPVPSALKGKAWQLQPLQKANAALTYEAYLTNPDAPVHRNGRCQTDEAYTWQDHIKQIEKAEQEHNTHKQFSFAILSAIKNKCLGCMHLMPLRPFLTHYNAPDHLLGTNGENSAMILYWLCRSHRNRDFSYQFISALHQWLDHDWELEGHLFRVDSTDMTAVQALQAAGLHLHFSLDVAVRPVPYAFYGR